jgi:hypothetical protein
LQVQLQIIDLGEALKNQVEIQPAEITDKGFLHTGRFFLIAEEKNKTGEKACWLVHRLYKPW